LAQLRSEKNIIEVQFIVKTWNGYTANNLDFGKGVILFSEGKYTIT